MSEIAPAVGLFVLGLALAVVYFGGLWWTVRRLDAARRPGLLLSVSTILRLALVIGVLAMLVTDHWRDFFICLAGFLIGRALLHWRLAHLHQPAAKPTGSETDPQSEDAESETASHEGA